jgi:CRISPR system Cascade subunit CasA
MDNMKPRDFTLSVQPLLNLPVEAEDRLVGMILAAEAAGVALRGALEPVLAAGEAREAEREAFFVATEDRLLKHVQDLKAGNDPRPAWLADLRAQALRQFDAQAVPGLDRRETDRIAQIVKARKGLAGAFAGYGKHGREMFTQLGMDLPTTSKGKAA